jgi:DNA-binding response OmpR family regulator
MYRSALKTAGYDVGAVEDGLDALRWVDAHAPDAIVLDLTLPRVGGRDVQRELRARAETRNIPIVIVTGGPSDDLDRSAPCIILQKPVEPDTLVDTVEKCLRGHSRGV